MDFKDTFKLAVMIVMYLIAVFLAWRFANASCILFVQNLKEGETSLDVLDMQALLNMDPSTQVALSGPGSPGHETLYFGPATFSAVERFQEKYALTVLFPSKLFRPTGFVGPATRAALSALVCT